MKDLGLTYIDGVIDLDLGDGGATIDETLRTAVIISLFSDRLADAADEIPDGSTDRRGWWGDIYPSADGDLIGSRLWLLGREKQLEPVLRRAETYAGEALQWMIDDAVAQSVDVSAQNPADGVLALQIQIRTASGQHVALTVTVDLTGAEAYLHMIADESGGLILGEAGTPLLP